ncbi:MAG: recombinase family protein [Phycisphaerales bacterium]|nr:recombinase family protein [Phycisphaerales bacterium]
MSQRAKSRPVNRCAIYTRKSSEEGLEQEFNSLDAQREAGEAYVKSQTAEGWTCLPDRYDDGGYTGGNMERPALQRLMKDIEAGRVDTVVVYKVDRLSRSLLDFARMMQVFESRSVSFVSVTQSFNTSDSMGRLMLNVLLSFAQFEREIISERTRDKMAAARRKGKWVGGRPILGYDVDPNGFRLVINEPEAKRVRAIFELYLKHESLIPTVRALNERGWLTKQWTSRKGKALGGRPFEKGSLYALLTNVAYLGKIRFKDELYEGEHQGIIDADVWQKAQHLLTRNGRTGGSIVRNKYGAILKGLLHCTACRRTMGHSYSCKKGRVAYRYYVCNGAARRGWDSCPSKSIPAAEIERIVVDQVRAIGKNRRLIEATLRHARQKTDDARGELLKEQTALDRQMRRHHAEVGKLAADAANRNGGTAARLGDLHERIRSGEERLAQIRSDIQAQEANRIDENAVRQALTEFDAVWENLAPKEQARVLRLLIERVEYDGAKGKVAITFRPGGPTAPAGAGNHEEAA